MKSVTLGALNGMLEAIDPFASYLNADQYRDYLKNKDVKRADVGLILSKKFGYVGVVGTIPGSPAAKAEVHDRRHDRKHRRRGDARHASGICQPCCCAARAAPRWNLSVVRDASSGTEAVKLTRANLALPPVESRCSPTRWAISTSTRFRRAR